MPPTCPIVLVVGASGAGKSTLCQRLRDLASARGAAPSGVLTSRRRTGAPAVGLDAVDAASGEHVPLAEFDRPTGGPSTGRWHFHDDAFARALGWCQGAGPSRLLIIDELGPLELVQQRGWASLVPLLADHAGPALVTVRPALADTLTRLLLPRDTVRVAIEPATREQAFARVVSVLGLGA